MTSDSNYHQTTGAYENWALLATIFAVIGPGTAIELAIIAPLTKASVFYIGFPVLLFLLVIIGFPMGMFFERLSHARFDKRQASFAESRAARVVNEWLVLLSVNFMHREGQPQRWYHYISNDQLWGKFT